MFQNFRTMIMSFCSLPYSRRSFLNSFKCLSDNLALIMLTFLIFLLPLASRLLLTWMTIILRSTLKIIISFDFHNHPVNSEDTMIPIVQMRKLIQRLIRQGVQHQSLSSLQLNEGSLHVQCSFLCSLVSAHAEYLVMEMLRAFVFILFSSFTLFIYLFIYFK